LTNGATWESATTQISVAGAGAGGGATGSGNIAPLPGTGVATPTPTPVPTTAATPAPTPGPDSGSQSKMTDVDPDYWAAEFIDDLVARGYVDGYPQDDDTFTYEPESKITRAELTKLVVVCLDLELIDDYDGSEFADWADVADWAKPYIGAAVEAGILLGSKEADGVYLLPDDNITREEMIAMVVRALRANVPGDGVSDAADRGDVSNWARDEVAFACNNGLINLDASGNINPRTDAKRSEAAMILSKMLEFLGL